MSRTASIALTAGEPAGIGPDLCLQLAQYQHHNQLVVIADPDLLAQRATRLKLPISMRCWHDDLQSVQQAGELYVLPVKLHQPVQAGVLNPANAHYVLDSLQLALQGCLTQRFDAVLTAPVHKAVINQVGIAFSGHTEFFAKGAGVDKVVMMLASEGLRVALATTHLPLSQVSAAITQNSLKQIIEIIHDSMRRQFGIERPRIAVCGLNPHAGESGHLGREEIEIINPVIASLKQQGLQLNGPWPADTIFNQDRLADYDVILAMYHDQGLPVLKHYAFGRAVNITLGLPFIRTSVDHGTALDIAGTGQSDVSSMQAALQMAETLIANQSKGGS